MTLTHEITEIRREFVLKPSGECRIGGWRHTHREFEACLASGHRLYLIDSLDLMDRGARFQHGENPEHSLVFSEAEMLEWDDSCLGFPVEGWIMKLHEREAGLS